MSNKTPAILSLALGLGLSAGVGYLFLDTRQLISTAETAPGTVVATFHPFASQH